MRSMTIVLFVLCSLLASAGRSTAEEVYLGMGVRIGEVTQDSAIIWTRVTKNTTRNADGKTDIEIVGRPKRRGQEFPVLTQEEVDALPSAVPGAAGRVRISYQAGENGKPQLSDWHAVEAEHDFTYQFHLQNLQPNTTYQFQVQAAPPGSDYPTDVVESSFTTAPTKEAWKDITFAVITCQMYHDLDDPAGFNIYPAMQKEGIDFVAVTGDNVYYDSELPRARNVAMARYHWHRMYSLPRMVDFYSKVPSYWEKDDHDTLSNDAWPGMKPKMMLPLTWEEGLEVFREQVPMGEKTYRTIRYGKGLQIWLVEGRDFRSPNNDPDGPEKSIWGKEQRDWLMKTILESDANYKILISPTPIVGLDRPNKKDNLSNSNFQWEGNFFRNWTQKHNLNNLFVCCGDRHWQYRSVDPETGLQEFSVGAASDEHAGGSPKRDETIQPFHRVKGGFLTVHVFKENDQPQLEMRFHDVHGKVVYTYRYDQ